MSKKWQAYEPERCWVGEGQKFCYGAQEEAEGMARMVEMEHGLATNSLYAYKCEFGEHWHLASLRFEGGIRSLPRAHL